MWRNKQPRPYAQRGKSLWGGCLFALAPGWPHAARADLNFSDVDDQRQSRGVFSSSLESTHFAVTDAGRMLDSNGASPDSFAWSDIGGRYAIADSFTAAVLVRPSVVDVTPITLQAIWAKAAAGAWIATNFCWSIGQNSNAGNVYVGEFFDAAFAFYSVAATSIPSINRTDMIVLRYDRRAGILDIWVNGIKQGSAAHGAAVRNDSTFPLRVQEPSQTSDSENKVGMLAMWNRAIATSEICALASDPFTMWRRKPPCELEY